MKNIDEIHTWKGFGGCESIVRVRIYDNVVFGGSVVLLTELSENNGTSVTNGVEKIVSDLIPKYKLNAMSTMIIEHYQQRGQRPADRESFDAVTLNRRFLRSQVHNGSRSIGQLF